MKSTYLKGCHKRYQLVIAKATLKIKKKTIKNPKFTKISETDFSKTLISRVNEYFEVNNISKHANVSMVLKTVFMLSVFFIPLFVLISGRIDQVWAIFALYIVSGVGMAGVGMGVMHDAIHGSYSKNKTVNKYVGFTMNLIGANATVWKIQHNVLHHSYTNIHGADDDINAPFFLRFSPDVKKNTLHRFQHIYVWLFYGLSTMSWVTTKDFIRLNRYRKMGFFKGGPEFKKEIMRIVAWKLLYFSYAIVLPMWMIPASWWVILLAFMSMHMVTGLITSIVFQTAHIMPDIAFPKPNEQGLIDSNWTLHQLATTTNYAPKSRVFSWFIGGLNYQVEHHLLPNICHIHYKKISKIVAKTAKEYGIPYHSKGNFFEAVKDHAKMLYTLGRADLVKVK